MDMKKREIKDVKDVDGVATAIGSHLMLNDYRVIEITFANTTICYATALDNGVVAMKMYALCNDDTIVAIKDGITEMAFNEFMSFIKTLLTDAIEMLDGVAVEIRSDL